MINKDLLIFNGASVRRFKSGEFIVHEGQEPQGYFQLLSGSVRWTNVEDDGREIIQEIIEPGESFAEFPLFDGLPYAASVRADEPSEVLWLPTEKFNDVFVSNSTLMLEFLKLFVCRMRFKFLITKELSNKPPAHRIQTLIGYLHETKRHYCAECSRILLTRQQMANMTGLRVETVIRVIRQMNDEGKLFIKRGKIYLDQNVMCNDRHCLPANQKAGVSALSIAS